MQFQIIPRQFDGSTVQTVNARELHSFLESRQDFSTWIKARIEQYGFVENSDYLLHSFMEQLPSGAKQKIDYHITIDMAKELAMVERNDKGREARKYFIECERRLKEQAPVLTNSPLAADIYAIGAIADVTRASESSRLGMVQKFVKIKAPHLLPVLPSYAIDAPIVAGETPAQSSEPHDSISAIIKGTGFTAAHANKRLLRAGLIKRMERIDSKGNPKGYWSVTEKGLEYGLNLTSPANPRETQPHWFLSKANEIVDIIRNQNR